MPTPNDAKLDRDGLKDWVCPHCAGKGSLPHIEANGKHQCKTCAPVHAVLEANERLEAELAEAKLLADINEQCARSFDRKQPFCEHENRYAFTDDGGKTGYCVMCANKQAREQRDKVAGLLKRAEPFVAEFTDYPESTTKLHDEIQSTLAALEKEKG